MWFDHLARRIQLSSIRSFPYFHLMVENVLPLPIYRKMLLEFPGVDAFEDKEDYPGRKTEVCRTFAGSRIWQQFNDYIMSDAFRDLLLKKFYLYGCDRNYGFLHRDKSGFHITPHTDVQSKRLSYIFYFPYDNSHAHLGTWLLTPKRPIEFSEEHKPWELFDRVAMAPYLRNSLFVWEVDRHSYHAVDVFFDSRDPIQYRRTFRGFIFREGVELPYTFAKEFEPETVKVVA